MELIFTLQLAYILVKYIQLLTFKKFHSILQQEQLVTILYQHTERNSILLHEDLIKAILPVSVVYYTDTTARLCAKVKFANHITTALYMIACLHTNQHLVSHILQQCVWSYTTALASRCLVCSNLHIFLHQPNTCIYETSISYIPDII